MKHAIIALLLVLVSCASLSDLHDFEDRAKDNLESFQEGAITRAAEPTARRRRGTGQESGRLRLR